MLIAGTTGQTAWMVADTLVTDPSGRDQNEHQLKIMPSSDGRALIGFAGERLRGSTAILHASNQPAGDDVIEYLSLVLGVELKAQVRLPAVEQIDGCIGH